MYHRQRSNSQVDRDETAESVVYEWPSNLVSSSFLDSLESSKCARYSAERCNV